MLEVKMYRNHVMLTILAASTIHCHSFQANCKCAPEDACWPTASEWNALNTSVSGKLIFDVQPAAPCYPGPLQDSRACAIVSAELTNQSFVSSTPIGLSYPTDSCPPVNLAAGQVPGNCSIGDQPWYTVNATTPEDVAKGICFAKKHGIRLVVRNTGHDILGRSTGYGSLQVWIKYIKNGVIFQPEYKPTGGCSKSTWKGSAFYIGGGYTWDDVYGEAAKRGLVVVGGGTPSVGCLGGWMQGGGHGPAAHDHGLGADQVLEARVVLASGELVNASPCENPGLLFAIRGGGPSTYGVVISTVIKAHPTDRVAAQQLSLVPKSPKDIATFFDAVQFFYASYPDLSDAGWSGYGSWEIVSPFPPYSAGFRHTIAIFGKTAIEAKEVFAPFASKLEKYKTRVLINTTYSAYPTFAAYYNALSGVASPIGQSGALGSRLLDRKALTGNSTALNQTLRIIGGAPDEFTSNNIIFCSGGQVARDAADPYSGLNPAWRTAYVHNVVARGWAPNSDKATKDSVHSDITYNKARALKQLAPNTGAYMNEGDVRDPDYLADFYGTHLSRLQRIKRRYDPHGVFYCPTCVGSEQWSVADSGKLCRVGFGKAYGGE